MQAHTISLQNDILLMPYVFLSLAILSLWVKRSYTLQGSLLLCAVIAGNFLGRLSILAYGIIFLLCIFFYCAYHHKNLYIRVVSSILGICLVIMMFMYKVPGFINLCVIDKIKLSEDSIPFSLYLNFDKAVAGFIILWLGFLSINKGNYSYKVFFKTLFIGLLATSTLIILSVYAHYIKFDPKQNEIFFIWAFSNLLFVCVAEEAFFRGLIQNSLANILGKLRYGNIIALILASILFGLAHIQGGMTYAIISTVAGLFYGVAYLSTKRIESAVMVHFMVNATHFLLFSYPALQH